MSDIDTTDTTITLSRRFSMDNVVDLVRKAGIYAYVEMTGGGCATIFAGAIRNVPGDGYRWSVIAGPGSYRWDSDSMGETDEFFIGPDDDGASIPYTVPSDATDEEIAAVIVAQASATLTPEIPEPPSADDEIVRVVLTVGDVRDYVDNFNENRGKDEAELSYDVGLDRAYEWAKYIEQTASGLASRQLDSVVTGGQP